MLKFSFYKYLLGVIIPLVILSLYGSITKKDIRVFPYLMIVIPAQIIGYGIGFFQAYVRRFLFNQEELVGFKKIIINDNNSFRNASQWNFCGSWNFAL